MKLLYYIISSLLITIGSSRGAAQSLLNANFNLGNMYWGCSPEIGLETLYGGTLSLNLSCEIDQSSALCQTITGLVPGNKYYLVMDASRRTGSCPSPSVTTIHVNMSGGVLAATLTRTNTIFDWSVSGFLFTASSSAHTFTLETGSDFLGSTCGMIVDNIAVVAAVLPITLIDFNGQTTDNGVQLSWSTAMEKDNDHFEIERSNDGLHFETISRIKSKSRSGQSQSRLDYSSTDDEPLSGMAYYRLKQTDFNDMSTYSKIVSISQAEQSRNEFIIYPNPNNGSFYLSLPERNVPAEMNIYSATGQLVYSTTLGDTGQQENIQSQLQRGIYYCRLTQGDVNHTKTLVVE